MMQQISLTGQWKMRRNDIQSDWYDAQVPGCVYTDLMLNGIIPDPFVEDKENDVQWVAEQDWIYTRSIEITREMLKSDHIDLVCDGLDTLAEVLINGRPFTSCNNMFCAQRWNIKALLVDGRNEISIIFHSPLSFTNQKMKERYLPCVENGIPGWAYLRKAASQYGWDWGPRLPVMGIWKDIRLEIWSTARLKDVFIRQHHYDKRVVLAFMPSIEVRNHKNLKIQVRVNTPNGDLLEKDHALTAGQCDVLPLYIDHPMLWWPNGYGGQPLYQVELSLWNGEECLDVKHYQIGLRTLELRQSDDPWGQSFTFVVNGVPIFCKGSNWIPADSFPARINRQQLEHLIRSAADVNQNMLRVWGGGYYESEDFYDLCDRYGILVWQDFMFSCAVYPLTDDVFLKSLHEEVQQVARRLRYRACLALWCGNNELEMGWRDWGWDRSDTQDLKQAYEHFFFQILPAWLMDDDPVTPYWPGSPSSGEALTHVNEDTAGDTHLWQVWHELKPFKYYYERKSRFVSEFGFQSLPSIRTIAAFAGESEWNLTSYIMEHHQKNAAGNGKMMTYLTGQYRFPDDFRGLVYLTQVQQAEALRVGVEHWRRNCECTSGALYWQINDCWPAASWSSIDYYGRWKAAHYAARHFFAPLLVSLLEDGKKVSIFASNDRSEIYTGSLRWSLVTLDGEILASDEQVFLALPAATTPVGIIDVSDKVNNGNQRYVVLAVEDWQDDHLVSMQVLPFVPDKHLALKPPEIKFNLISRDGRITMTLISESLARFVELSIKDNDVIFSDNYFNLPARKAYTVEFTPPPSLTLEEIKGAINIYTLIDTFKHAA